MAGSRTLTASLAAGLTVLTLIGVAQGRPFVTPDDHIYTAAAINLVEHGRLFNPHIPSWNAAFATAVFPFHPPMYSYVLAGWLGVFGISSASIMAFQWLAGIAAACAYGFVLHRFRVPLPIVLPAAWLLLATLLDRGFRYEPLAFALLWSGLAAFDAARADRAAAGLILIGCAGITMPTAPAIASPFAVALVYLSPAEPLGLRRETRRRLAVGGLAAVCTTVLLFGVLVRFDFRGFLVPFFEHVRYVAGQIDAGRSVVSMLFRGWNPLLELPTFVLWAACLVVGFARPMSRESRLVVAASTISAALYVILYPARGLAFTFAAAWLTIPIVLSRRRTPAIVLAAVAGVFVISQTRTIVMFAFQRTDASENHAEIRARAAVLGSDRPILIDSFAARFIYDYRLPPAALSWEFRDFARGPSAPKEPGAVWVVQKHNGFLGTQQHVVAFGRTFRSLQQDPNEIAIIE